MLCHLFPMGSFRSHLLLLLLLLLFIVILLYKLAIFFAQYSMWMEFCLASRSFLEMSEHSWTFKPWVFIRAEEFEQVFKFVICLHVRCGLPHVCGVWLKRDKHLQVPQRLFSITWNDHDFFIIIWPKTQTRRSHMRAQ